MKDTTQTPALPTNPIPVPVPIPVPLTFLRTLRTLALASAIFALSFVPFDIAIGSTRYLVIIEHPAAFQQMHLQFSQHPAWARKGLHLQALALRTETNGRSELVRPFAGLGNRSARASGASFDSAAGENSAMITIEDSLPHLQTLVVRSENDSLDRQELLDSGLVKLVEEEVFWPTPRLPIPPARRIWTSTSASASAMDPNPGSVFAPNPGNEENGRILNLLPPPTPFLPTLPWGIMAVHSPGAWAQGALGQGVRVLILDTGADIQHPALANRFETGKNFANDGQALNDVSDQVGHGTHVAGTICGTTLPSGFSGVAPQASFLMGRVCSTETCSSIGIVKGINWALTMKVDVVNLSLGGPAPTAGEQKAIEAAHQAGISVVAASGNGGRDRLNFPAAFPTVVSVGAITEQFVRASFSQYGQGLDLVAPGTDVLSSVPRGKGLHAQIEYVQSEGPNQGSTPGPMPLPPPLPIPMTAAFTGSPLLTTPLVRSLVFVEDGSPKVFQRLGTAVRDQMVLMRLNPKDFTPQLDRALKARVAAVIYISSADEGLAQGDVREEDGRDFSIPVVSVDALSSQYLVQTLQRAPGSISLRLGIEQSDYEIFAGTSMATPHVTGIVALLKSMNRSLRPMDVLQILTKSAQTLPLRGEFLNTFLLPNLVVGGVAGPTHPQNWEYGAGLVDAERAVQQALRPGDLTP